MLADGLEEVRVPPGDRKGVVQGVRRPLDAVEPGGLDERVTRCVLVEQPDRAVVVEPLRIARGLGEQCGQRGKSCADHDDGQGRVALVDVVHSGVHRRELGARGLLQLVDEDQGADAELAAGLAEHLEEVCQVVAEPSGVGDAQLVLDLDAEGDGAGRVDRQGERLERTEQAGEPRDGMAAGRRPHGLEQGCGEGLGQAGPARHLDLHDDPPVVADEPHQLVEQRGLPDPTQAVEHPGPVTLRRRDDAFADDPERDQEVLAAGDHRRATPRPGPEGVADLVHASEFIKSYIEKPYTP